MLTLAALKKAREIAISMIVFKDLSSIQKKIHKEHVIVGNFFYIVMRIITMHIAWIIVTVPNLTVKQIVSS